MLSIASCCNNFLFFLTIIYWIHQSYLRCDWSVKTEKYLASHYLLCRNGKRHISDQRWTLRLFLVAPFPWWPAWSLMGTLVLLSQTAVSLLEHCVTSPSRLVKLQQRCHVPTPSTAAKFLWKSTKLSTPWETWQIFFPPYQTLHTHSRGEQSMKAIKLNRRDRRR